MFSKISWINQEKSERLRVNQDNVLTPDEQLIDVACMDLAVSLGTFFLTGLCTLCLRRGSMFILVSYYGVCGHLRLCPAVASLAGGHRASRRAL